ncbi:patatin-like protein [Ilumatobacter sp.]|uniref:patatin-like protein n=1 Tax=Ilumatobacter sp. TaxID=1967498 RepID=UPI003C53CCA1
MGGPRIETRISLVLYGGVSLAVYISGACQELLSLVRATADPSLVADADLTRAERVYRDLARTAGAGDTPRRVTVDVLSGSSAGGLNAVFLGKALTHGGTLDGLTEIWRAEADFLKLLNESADPPKSILNGDHFYELLRDALDAMGGADDRRKGLVPAVDCYLTTTDLRGVAEDVRLYDTSIQEMRHRARFHFRDGLSSAIGTHRVDLSEQNNDVLAFAARATAAHPAAFHPANWGQVNNLAPGRSARDVALHEFLSPAHGPDGLDGSVNVKQRWYSDGGAMDNKPFAYALEPLTTRRADIPVERRVVYIEPDPSRSTGNWQDPRFPGLREYTIDTYGLARTENIRDDIAALNAGNEEISRLNESLSALFLRTDDEILDALRTRIGTPEASEQDETESDVEGPEATEANAVELSGPDLVARGLGSGYDRESTTSGVVGGWTAQTRTDYARERGWGAVAQEEYRWSTVVTDLVQMSLQIGELTPDPAQVRRLSTLVKSRLEDWVRTRFSGAENVGRIGLFVFDVGFRLRRFTLLEHLISHHQRRLNNATADDDSLDATARQERFDRYATVRRNINRLYLKLVTFSESQRAIDFGLRDPEVLGDLSLDEWIATDAFFEVVDDVANRLSPPLRESSENGRRVILAAEIDDSMRIRLTDAWLNYGDYDQLILPLASVASAELDPADVIRISPLDARGLVAEGITSPRKLGGNALSHFGGFLDEKWRLNDILWGRLDTAEIAVTKILGASPDDARRVQRALLEDLAIDLRKLPTEASPLSALLAVNQRHRTQRHADAARAVEALIRPSDPNAETTWTVADDEAVNAAVDAVIDLLAPAGDATDSWSVDLSTGGDRGTTKIQLFERGAQVIGTTLARQAEDPFTGGDGSPTPTRSWLAFVGRMISWLIRRALPTRVARGIVFGIAGALIAAGVVGLGMICVTESWGWLSCLLIAAGLAGGAAMTLGSLRRVRPLRTQTVVVTASLVTAVIVAAFVVNWLAAAACTLFVMLITGGFGFWAGMAKIRRVLVDLGNPKQTTTNHSIAEGG